MICSELTTFAVESPTFDDAAQVFFGCDLLRINYLCGRITNSAQPRRGTGEVVICSELTTFAVESPTIPFRKNRKGSCDLLRINYLCGRITNYLKNASKSLLVVICSELTTFAVESPTLQGTGIAH